ncbi:hypothetical protein AAMO2058_000087600 [Amorphochlora amoebiformis]
MPMVQGNKGYARLHRRGLILTGSRDRDWGLSPKGKHWFRRLRRCKIGYQASTTASRSENDRDTKDTKYYCLRILSVANFRVPSVVHEILRKNPDLGVEYSVNLSFIDYRSGSFFGKTVSTTTNAEITSGLDSKILRRVDWRESLFYKSKCTGAMEDGVVELVLNIVRKIPNVSKNGEKGSVIVEEISLGWTRIKVFGEDVLDMVLEIDDDKLKDQNYRTPHPEAKAKCREDTNYDRKDYPDIDNDNDVLVGVLRASTGPKPHISRSELYQGSPQALLCTAISPGMRRATIGANTGARGRTTDEEIHDAVATLTKSLFRIEGSYIEYQLSKCPPLEKFRRMFRNNEPFRAGTRIPGLGSYSLPNVPHRLNILKLKPLLIRIEHPRIRVSSSFEDVLLHHLVNIRKNRWDAPWDCYDQPTIKERMLKVGVHNGLSYLSLPQKILFDHAPTNQSTQAQTQALTTQSTILATTAKEDIDKARSEWISYFHDGAFELETMCDISEPGVALVIQYVVSVEWRANPNKKQLKNKTPHLDQGQNCATKENHYTVGWTARTLGPKGDMFVDLGSGFGLPSPSNEPKQIRLSLHDSPPITPEGELCVAVLNKAKSSHKLWLDIGADARVPGETPQSPVKSPTPPSPHPPVVPNPRPIIKLELKEQSVMEQNIPPPEPKPEPQEPPKLPPAPAKLQCNALRLEMEAGLGFEGKKKGCLGGFGVGREVGKLEADLSVHILGFDSREVLGKVGVSIHFFGSSRSMMGPIDINKSYHKNDFVADFTVGGSVSKWKRYIAYLYTGCLAIELNDYNTLMPIGTATIVLQSIMLQGHQQNQIESRFDVYQNTLKVSNHDSQPQSQSQPDAKLLGSLSVVIIHKLMELDAMLMAAKSGLSEGLSSDEEEERRFMGLLERFVSPNQTLISAFDLNSKTKKRCKRRHHRTSKSVKPVRTNANNQNARAPITRRILLQAVKTVNLDTTEGESVYFELLFKNTFSSARDYEIKILDSKSSEESRLVSIVADPDRMRRFRREFGYKPVQDYSQVHEGNILRLQKGESHSIGFVCVVKARDNLQTRREVVISFMCQRRCAYKLHINIDTRPCPILQVLHVVYGDGIKPSNHSQDVKQDLQEPRAIQQSYTVRLPSHVPCESSVERYRSPKPTVGSMVHSGPSTIADRLDRLSMRPLEWLECSEESIEIRCQPGECRRCFPISISFNKDLFQKTGDPIRTKVFAYGDRDKIALLFSLILIVHQPK